MVTFFAKVMRGASWRHLWLYVCGKAKSPPNIQNRSQNEIKFTKIFRENRWGSAESRSGTGSELVFTSGLRGALPPVIKKYEIESIFDGGCGDFNWMRQLLPSLNVDYLGGEIVKPLVKKLRKYRNDRVNFIQFDLVREVPPRADLMIIRDVLFHLSQADTRAVMRNFLLSGTPLLLTTTHDNSRDGFRNEDIRSGHWRLIDLFGPPYGFPEDPLEKIEDWAPPENRRYICLWTREQVELCNEW